MKKKRINIFKGLDLNKDIKNILYTFIGGIFLIATFFIIPTILEVNKNNFFASFEFENNSKDNFLKALNKKNNEQFQSLDDELDTGHLLDDVPLFYDSQSESKENDTVRLSAKQIEDLFSETNYNLLNVRRTKLVQPIPIDHLPKEMKIIDNTKKRKSLFIKIILPLIIEENNNIKLDRIKLFSILNKNTNSNAEKKWLNSKFKQYGVVNKDLLTLKVRMDVIPVSLAIAQAANETAWGKSRFALEGNALFGQWTWSGEGIKPAAADTDATHKVMRFNELKFSIRAYQRNLNTHASYKDFRMVRGMLRDKKKNLDSIILVNYLSKYAQTGEEYIINLKKIIKQNNLRDFDDARLMPSTYQLKSLI